MENKIEIKRDLAHVDYESGRYQTMKEHSENVANYVAETCSLSELKILVSLIGVFHDVGKLGRENQEVLREFYNMEMILINMVWIILLLAED